MERKLSSRKYALAFLLTLAVFGGGIVLGILLEDARLRDAREITLHEKVTLRSLQLQQNYIASGDADCSALNQILEANVNELGKKVNTITSYQKKAFFNDEEFNLQLRDYFLTEMQFLFLSQEIDRQCEKDNIKILYFYDENEFDTQGNILDYLRGIFEGKVWVFSFDSSFQEEPMIGTLLTSYNITRFPSVAVEERTFHGHTDMETLRQSICQEFKAMGDVPQECHTS